MSAELETVFSAIAKLTSFAFAEYITAEECEDWRDVYDSITYYAEFDMELHIKIMNAHDLRILSYTVFKLNQLFGELCSHNTVYARLLA